MTDEAYLLTALHAWEDPMCRSFCRSHRFFCLRRGEERRENDVSVISRDSWILKGNVVDTRVRPVWVWKADINIFRLKLQIAYSQCL